MRTMTAWAILLTMASTAATAEPAMWVVRGPVGEVTLFGTVHELPPGTEWLSPRIAARIDAADSIVIETILPTEPAALGALVATAGTARGVKPLAERLGPERVKKLAQVAQRLGVPIAALAGSKTWFVALLMAGIAATRDGLSPTDGVEPLLTARAAAKHKPLIGLERPAEQFGFFDALPEADQQALLDTTLDEMPTAAADARALIASWAAGHPEAIDTDKELHATPRLEKLLLTDRNARWAAWIAGVVAHPGKVFVAVGAAHLTGLHSVQSMLAARGFVVERIE